MITCERYQQELRHKWDSFVENSKTPLFFFRRDFIEYHKDRFNDYSLVFYKENKIIAIFPAVSCNDILNSHAGLTYGGVLFDSKIKSQDIFSVLSCLFEYATNNAYKKIVYKSIPYIFHKQGAQEDIYFLFNRFNGCLVRRDISSAVYLSNRLPLSKLRKRLTNKAKKNGLVTCTSTNWEAFHQLLCFVLKKHNAKPVHSIDELKYLADIFPKNIQLQVIMDGANILAGTTLFKFNNVVHTQYLAVSDKGKEYGALDYLIESCIQESKIDGYSYFSLGISTENQGKHLNGGLISQKEGFGARGITVDTYEVLL